MDIKLIIAKCLKRFFNPPALRNTKIDKTSKVLARCDLNYVTVDRYSYIGYSCFALNARIGAFCSIAEGCKLGGAVHPMHFVSTSPVFYHRKNIMKKNFSVQALAKTPEVIIENDVWLGMGVIVKSGVTIHTGAVVGAGSVVTKDIPPYEIWAGNPAKYIRSRFDPDLIEKLLGTQWWTWEESKIKEYAEYFNNPNVFLEKIDFLK